jgi:dolichol-phosphate mannosyltransferase
MPAFNEEASIRAVITDHANYVRDLGFEAWEIVCVDDASTDATTQILADLQPVIPQLVVERHDVNRGIYRSFRDGFLRSGGEFIYETGSDGQWPFENLAPMVEQLRAGADLVVGVRNN